MKVLWKLVGVLLVIFGLTAIFAIDVSGGLAMLAIAIGIALILAGGALLVRPRPRFSQLERPR